MNKEKDEIIKLLNTAQSYFGKDEKIYIFKCNKCHKMDPVPGFLVGEQIGFLKFIKKKHTPKFVCPFCGASMYPIDISKYI